MDDPRGPLAAATPIERSYRALEYSFRIRTPLPRVAALVDDLLSPFRAEGVNGAPVYALTRSETDGLFALSLDGRRIGEMATAGGLVHSLLWDVHKRAVVSVRGFLALHAGAVVWRDVGVVFPGPTESGKTTLVAALVKAGFAYLSDEAALIEPQSGRLHPFPKSLTLRPETFELLPGITEKLAPEFAWTTRLRYHVPVDAIRANALGGPCNVRYIIAPTYVPGTRSGLEPLSRAQSLMNLSRNAFNPIQLDRDGLSVLANVVRGANSFRMQVGDLESAVNVVKTVVDADHEQAAGG